MELIDAGDLYAQLHRRRKSPELPEKDVKFYVAAVTDALAAIHARVILYRDLKPENIFLCAKGYPRVADFGLAKKCKRTYTVCGTPDYMSPEIILAKGHDSAADTWAVGVLIFEMATGANSHAFPDNTYFCIAFVHWPLAQTYGLSFSSLMKR